MHEFCLVVCRFMQYASVTADFFMDVVIKWNNDPVNDMIVHISVITNYLSNHMKSKSNHCLFG